MWAVSDGAWSSSSPTKIAGVGESATASGPQPTLGSIIRHQRELMSLPMRQLATMAGISNPYLSQIERDLRAPSDAVLTAIARCLQTTAEDLYAQAGFTPSGLRAVAGETSAVLETIAAAAELTAAQRRALIEVYRGFVEANAGRRPPD